MPTYKVIKSSNSVEIDSSITIEAESILEAETKALEFIRELNQLGNEHPEDWILKTITEVITAEPPPSCTTPEPIIQTSPRDPE